MGRVVSILKDAIIAFLLALLIRTFAVQAYKIPTGSMEPTLLVGDYILVNRLAYGFRFPYVGYLVRWGEIERGDVVVFIYPEDPSKDFIKRVIGLPGEILEIKEKKIYINGKILEENWGFFKDEKYIGSPRDDFGPVEIPKDRIFVMGDNRDESNDSRFWGTVPIENVKGKAFLIYFSWDPINKKVRTYRIFSVIR